MEYFVFIIIFAFLSAASLSSSSSKAVFARKKLMMILCVAFVLVCYVKTEAFNRFLKDLRVQKIGFVDSPFLENLLEAKHKPRQNGQSIFFLESNTDQNQDQNVFLTPRQACAVESAAFTNPDQDVFMIFLRKVGFLNGTKLPVIDAIMSYKNVHVNYVDIQEYSKDSPIEEWMRGGLLFNSSFILEHTSDVVRFLTLWRYTGTYVDLDFIVQKRIDLLGNNFACNQEDDLINNAFLNLDVNGRKIAEKLLEHTIKAFQPKLWTANGPDAFTKIIQDMCNTTDVKNMTKENCQGFTALPISNCYEIGFRQYQMFFNENNAEEVMRRVENSTVVHFWNKMSVNEKLKTNSKAAYIQMAQKFCPKVLKASGEQF